MKNKIHPLQIIECIPNFSEGKRVDVVARIEEVIREIHGIKVMRTEMDTDHNRAVLSFIGPPDSVITAAYKACKEAAELIDLTDHDGVHPRIGSTDVIPLVPLFGVSIEECVKLATNLGRQIAEDLHIPVYFYEDAAIKPEHKNLAHIRQGGFELLKRGNLSPNRVPDLGGPNVHPTAGAVAIGVRKPLIAYNINLNTDDLKIARRIARVIRERDGGMPAVKALGLRLKDKGLTQVSINLTDYKKTSIVSIFEKVRYEAEKYGVEVVESELIGLIDLEAIAGSVTQLLQLKDFDISRILDHHVFSYGDLTGNARCNEK